MFPGYAFSPDLTRVFQLVFRAKCRVSFRASFIIAVFNQAAAFALHDLNNFAAWHAHTLFFSTPQDINAAYSQEKERRFVFLALQAN